MRGIFLPGTTLVLGAVLGALLLSLVATGPAGAAFPGGNGKIAFTSNRDGNFEIYTMNPDGSSQTRLTTTPGLTSGVDTSPAFSYDGSKIVFESSRPSANPSDTSTDREIYVMNADGTNQTPLTANTTTDAEPAFSPDGTKVAFTSNQPAADGTTDREIWVMNADGKGSQLNLTNAPGDDETPAWSPDGTRIAFERGDPGVEIVTINADGSGMRSVTDTTPQDPNAGGNQGKVWSFKIRP